MMKKDLFSDTLNYVSDVMQFSLEEKIEFSVFPEAILQEAYNIFKHRDIKFRPKIYLINVCKNLAKQRRIFIDYSQIQYLRTHPLISAILSEHQKNRNPEEKLSLQAFWADLRRSKKAIQDAKTDKSISQWKKKDYRLFFVKQLEGDIRSACRITKLGKAIFYPEDFHNKFAAPEDVELANREQHEDINNALIKLIDTIIPKIDAFVEEYYENLQEARAALIKTAHNPYNCDKETSVKEIASISDVMNTPWYKNLLKEKSDLFQYVDALGREIIRHHQENINRPG